MPFYIHTDWMYFCIAVGIALLVNLLMSFVNKKFFLMHVVIRKFSILDLEFPASAQELATIVKDIFKLPGDLLKKTLKALKTHLYLDFIFMPALYISIFIFSMNVAMKMIYFGHKLFGILAWLQLVSWACDIVENIYLLNKLRPDAVVSKPAIEKGFAILEIVKWGIPLITLVCSFAAIFYYWLVGNYSHHSLYFISTLIMELVIFLILKRITAKTEKQELENFNKASN